MEPLISVVMPVYNQEKYLAETIESVLNQSFKDFEFIILDDGSTDNSAQIIRQYAAKDERIVPFFQANTGKCVATNSLVAKARGKWCAFLDADDVMLPKRLEKQLGFHLEHPEIDASSSHCYYINKDSHLLGKQFYENLSTIKESRSALASNKIVNCSFTGMMVSTKAFKETGGLRSAFWPCEDYDFVNRFIEKGYLLVIIQDILMKYRIHPSAVTVREPFHILNKIGWVDHCTRSRRANKPEISFNEFLDLREKESWLFKLERMRFNYAQIFFRRAGMAMMSREYLNFSWQFLTASLLSPNLVLRKILNLRRI